MTLYCPLRDPVQEWSRSEAFLVVLAFAEHRNAEGKNFIFAAEEPELHLHPALHRRLANRIRSLSTQSIITTHSPLIAASYQAASSLFVRKASREESSEFVIRLRPSGSGRTQSEQVFEKSVSKVPGTLLRGSLIGSGRPSAARPIRFRMGPPLAPCGGGI